MEGGTGGGLIRSGHQLISILLTSQSRIVVKKGVFTNTLSKFASAVIDGVIGPPRLVQHY